jgi:exodeoxyribonuclease-3
MGFKIISWNINSVKKRMNQIINFLHLEDPDFLFLQETRCESFEDIHGYHTYHHNGTGGRNGVAIISKYPLEVVEMQEERYISCKMGDLYLISVYVYNGGSFFSPVHKKIEFLNTLVSKVRHYDTCIVGGDFNILYNKHEYSGINPYGIEETHAFKYFESNMEFHPSQKEYYTWWDYRHNSLEKNRGMGLDKFYYKGVIMEPPRVLKRYREYSVLGVPSDHAPIASTFSLIS